jgi:predicted amidohydrolase
MNICLIQTEPEIGNNNLQFASECIRRYNADFYVLPELFTVGFGRGASHVQECAETLNGILVQTLHSALESKPEATVVAGLAEKDSDNFYNTAAIIQRQSVAAYRQKNPVPGFGRRFIRGDFGIFFVGPERHGYRSRIGVMICSDYLIANKFFSHYKGQRVDAIIMIADSAESQWRREFPDLCREHGIPAIVCNAAGTHMGGSCIWDAGGNEVPIRQLGKAEVQRMTEESAVGFASLDC